MEDKKAEEIVLLDVQGQCPFADFFLICSGTSDRMLGALEQVVAEGAHKEHVSVRREGRPESGWVLVDAGSVIVHVFTPQRRSFYSLEKLWKDGKVLLRIQ